MKKSKTLICLLLTIVMAFSWSLSLSFANDNNQKVEIQTLATPSNLIWKDGSTATASWDAVVGANYYIVNVYVSAGNKEIGSTETGSSATEIDLQHEINLIIGTKEYETYDVVYDVKAQYINDEELVESSKSEKSGVLSINSAGKIKLKTPTNVMLNDNHTITWSNFDNNALYYHFYYKIVYNNQEKTGYGAYLIAADQIENENGIAEIDSIQALKSAYNSAGYTEENVEIQLAVKATAYFDSEYSDSTMSEYSNSITYSGGKTVLKTPNSLNLTDDGMLTWSNYDENTYFYNVYYKIEFEGSIKTGYASQGIYQNSISVEDNHATANVTDALKNAYDEAGYKGETVQISLQLFPTAYFSSDYSDGAMSDFSNSIQFSFDGKTKLAKPINLHLNNDYTITWENYDEKALYYHAYYKIEYNDETKTGYASYLVEGSKLSPNEGVVTTDFSQALENAYDIEGYSGETVKIAFRIYANVYSSDYANSDYSEYSNYIYYNPAGSTVIDEITLSPEHPVIAVGKDMYIGKTINPANAYYSKVNWSTDDNSTAPIDANGKVTGAKKGNANITAQINNATKTIPVSIYEIASNIDDSDQSAMVTDTATAAIDSLIEDGDATGTDITDVETACEEIVQAAQNGDQFNVDCNVEEKTKNELNSSWSDIQNAVGDKEFAAAYDVTVGISHTDSESASHHIGNLTTFDSEVGFELEKPDNLPAVTENCNREFTIARIHEGNIETIPFIVKDNGNFQTSSNIFSDFVLLYKDIPCSHDYQNPVFNWSDDGKSCTITYTCSVNADHKITYDCNVTSDVKEAATCSKKGTTTYTATYEGLSDTKDVADIDYDMASHDYKDPVFNWSDDGKSCTVTYTCARNVDHKVTYDCNVTSAVKEAATCSKKGTTRYTATYEGLSDTKDVVDIDYDMSSHDYKDPVFSWSDDCKSCTVTYTCTRNADHKAIYDCTVIPEVKEAATCTKKGTTRYTAAYEGLTDSKDVIDIEIDSNAHIFNETYSVDVPASCAKEGCESIHCSECGISKEGSERVIKKTNSHNYGAWKTTKEATCKEDGRKERTCSVCSDKVTEVIPATGHEWDAPTYSWATNYGSVTATRVCKNDPAHKETEIVKTNSKVSMPATYTKKGQTTYTASFSNAAFSKQTKTVTNIPLMPKKAQSIAVKAFVKTVKAKKLKKKALAVAPIRVTNAKGSVTYIIVGSNAKSKRALKINAKTGKVTVKKKTKKGTYKLRVKVTAAGNTEYIAGSKTVGIAVKVK